VGEVSPIAMVGRVSRRWHDGFTNWTRHRGD